MALRIQSNHIRLKLAVAATVFVLALQPIAGLLQTHSADAAPNTTYTNQTFGGLTWSTDRTAPSGGYSAAGNLTMHVDGSAPNANQSFYKYEGVKAPLPAGTSSVKADLYIDPTWSGHDVIVGMWGQVESATTTANCGGDGCAWPTLEFSNMNGSDHTATVDIFDTFTGNYEGITNVAYGSTATLEVSVNKYAGKINYYLNDSLIYSHSNVDASVTYDTFKQVIFNNRNAGTDYTVQWSNLKLGTFDPIPTVVSPAHNGYVTSNDFWFDWSDVDGATGYEAQFSQSGSTDSNGALNNNVWAGDYQHHQPTASTLHSVGASGTWYWQVRTVFPGGVKSGWSPVWKMTIDTTAPSAPTNLRWKTSTNVTVADTGITNVYGGTASWTGVSDADHYVYKYWNDIAGNPYKVGSEYTTTTTSTNLPGVFNQGDGVHHFCVAAVDAAGNTSACTVFTITYDATPPVATITAPSDGSTLRGTVPVSGDVVDNNPMNSYFSIYKTGSSSPVLTSLYADGRGTHSLSWDTTTVADGQYDVYFETRDKAGNKDGSLSSLGASVKKVTVIVDNTAPTVVITSAVRNSDGTLTITGTTDDNSSKVIVTIDGASQPAITPASGTWTLTTALAYTNVAHQVAATSTDTAGNKGSTAPRTVAADAALTAITSNGTVPAARGATTPFFGTQQTGNGTTTQDVLGAETADQKSSASDLDSSDVKGTSDTKDQSKNTPFEVFGLAWYWWLAVLATIIGLWWIIAAARRRRQED